MNLRQTLKLAHEILKKNNIDHALIGGLALACYGSTRATVDLDLIIDEKHREEVKKLFLENGFKLDFSSLEVLQFSGNGYVDVLLARRPIARKILLEANPLGPEGISFIKAEDIIGLKIQAYKNNPEREFQDKADILFLLKEVAELDMIRIKEYADLFNAWEEISELKKKIKY